MIRDTPETDLFKKKLYDSLLKEASNYPIIKIAKHNSVYTAGDKEDIVYFIESGQIKLSIISPQGKECILAIHTLGDIFGELCIGDLVERQETATAMKDTELRQIPSSKFIQHLNKESLSEGFIKYLAVRVVKQQHVIAGLVVVDSEERLGNTLLELARSHGIQDPRSILIKLLVSYEELANMIGTNDFEISLFMQRFHNLELIEITKEDHIIVKEKNLVSYLSSIA